MLARVGEQVGADQARANRTPSSHRREIVGIGA
jgi:hypothetical protein